jgi:ubiquinone/menaquinone biosynthesis C-methylase UbiE
MRPVQSPAPIHQPKPDLFFDTLTAYQKTAALKAAIDLNLFTTLNDSPATVSEIATSCSGAARGTRILCDYLTVHGFLHKTGDRYSLTPDSAMFLSRKSPGYAGNAVDFLLSDHLTTAFQHLSVAVRNGGTAEPQRASVTPDHPMWLTFAQTMGGLMLRAADALADLLPLDQNRPTRVLDVSASHGAWGIAFARKNPETRLVALDWPAVLEITARNAEAAGISNRFSTLAGSAFEVDLGSAYDVVLIPNFLHHFGATECTAFLKRCHAALRPGGRVAIVEFIPNPDRITPPQAAGFSLVMLATTPSGDAYTAEEYEQMLSEAGFVTPSLHALPSSPNQVLIAQK